jgi:Protein of unknown function (DUF2971)
MALPPLYKFLSVEGAKLTLGNNTFRHAKPSDFNDIEDLTVQSIFPEEIEVALKKLDDGFTDVILAHLNDPPTCASPMREKLAMIQKAYRSNPDAAKIIKAELAKDGRKPLFDVEHMRSRAKEHLKEINEFMQRMRVLCVTTNKDSARMWEEYAQQHKGIALRIEANIAKDSKFQRFQPVIYRETRPALHDDTLEFIAGGLFGDKEARIHAILEKIIYSKTLKWQHESEYRLAIPLGKDEAPYDTLKYHPEEITELYLGSAMDKADKEDILAKAKALNPAIRVFQAKCGAGTAITFEPHGSG